MDYTPLKISNGTPKGRLARYLMATFPINELGFRNAKPIGLRPQLNGNPPKEDCPISNLHRCNHTTTNTTNNTNNNRIYQLLLSYIFHHIISNTKNPIPERDSNHRPRNQLYNGVIMINPPLVEHQRRDH